jgi:hypothetical protein
MDEVRLVTVVDLVSVSVSVDGLEIVLQLSGEPHPLLAKLIEGMEPRGDGVRFIWVSGDLLSIGVDVDPDYATKVVATLIDEKMLELKAEQARAILAKRTEAEESVRGVLVTRGILPA